MSARDEGYRPPQLSRDPAVLKQQAILFHQVVALVNAENTTLRRELAAISKGCQSKGSLVGLETQIARTRNLD